MAKAREMATHMMRSGVFEGGRYVVRVEPVSVRVLARAEGYAMVRRPRAMPYVVNERDLQEAA